MTMVCKVSGDEYDYATRAKKIPNETACEYRLSKSELTVLLTCLYIYALGLKEPVSEN